MFLLLLQLLLGRWFNDHWDCCDANYDLITIYSYIFRQLSSIASGILSPAANYLFNYIIIIIMPVLFLIAALDAGKKIGFPAIIFGVLSQFILGNAIPGIVLGILVGSSWDQKGILSV